MTDDRYTELAEKMTVLFEEYGVVAFGGILFEENSGAVVSANGVPYDHAMTVRCDVLKHALQRLATEVFFVETDGILIHRPIK